MMKKWPLLALALTCLFIPGVSGAEVSLSEPAKTPAVQSPRALDYSACVSIAIENNRTRTISALAVDMAELQHKQALSSYWPGLMLNASMSRFDEGPDFIFSSPGFNGLKVNLMEKDMRSASLDLSWPLYTGGQRSVAARQAEIGVSLSREDARRTDLQMMYDVKRMYYGAVLARKLRDLGREIQDHFNALLLVTENFYTAGSLTVSKCDYLSIKTLCEGVRSYMISLESQVELSDAALLNTLGIPYDTALTVADTTIPCEAVKAELPALVGKAYAFNPDYRKADAALEALELSIEDRKSGYLPTLTFAGKLYAMGSSEDSGLMTDTNQNGYTLGLYMQLPVFSGFLTKNRIKEARTRLKAGEEQKILLKDGLAIQVKHAFIELSRYGREVDSGKKAADTAEENRQLNVKAYDHGLTELKNVTEALILETFFKMHYETARYRHLETLARLEWIVGRELHQILEP